MKHFTLCADDYGLNAAISEGIITLVERKRLTAVSCMTSCRTWPEHALWLKPYLKTIDIGLHFNLTEGKPLGKLPSTSHPDKFFTLPKLLTTALTHRLNENEIIDECHRQLDAFIEHIGLLPDFIDGHQHIQTLPIVRNALIKVYESRLANTKAYLRVPGNALLKTLKRPSHLKALVIYSTGVRKLRHLLTQHHIPHNQSFSGVYHLKLQSSEEYQAYFRDFLNEIDDHGLILCHPGLPSSDPTDPIAQTREREFSFFNSDEFLKICKQANAHPSRFTTLNSPPNF